MSFSDVDVACTNLRNELRIEISRAMECQIRWMVTFNIALVAAALAGARLLL